MKDIQTVLFDLDGTLIDTNELIKKSFRYTFEQYQLSFTDEEISKFNGPPLRETFKKYNPDQVDEMIETYREHNLLHHKDYVQLFPHVIETLEQLKGKQIKLGIVTSKMKDSALVGIELTGLTPFFETIVTWDDVVHAKPHPEPVLKALHALKGNAKSALMIGDNYHDIVSGQRAGVKTAGVAWSRKGEDFLKSYKPTYMLQDMRDVLTII
ncbi:MAG TPA: pyrophosphatase PpaX [Virgibacillus sp.]|nr:pyrophosphatase PpaX [Virgibacillus sp.]